MPNRNATRNLIFLLLLSPLGAGCAAKIPAEPSIEAARSAISEAKRNEATQYAASELAKAQEKLNLAEEELRNRNLTEARRLGEQATVDARYAQVRAQAEKAQSAATENRDTTETIQGVR